MDDFQRIHEESFATVQDIMRDQRERLISNAEQVKGDIKKAFGCYLEWLREREAVLMRGVDRAVEAHLSRWQSSVCEALVSLRTLKESVELLDDGDRESGESGTPRDVKEQIERLLTDMSLAMQSDLKMAQFEVVKFEESGKAALRTSMDNCGEVYTQSTERANNAALVKSTSKWSNWLHSSVNLEHLEEPEFLYDFDDMGSGMFSSKLAIQAAAGKTRAAAAAQAKLDSRRPGTPVGTSKFGLTKQGSIGSSDENARPEAGRKSSPMVGLGGEYLTQLITSSSDQWLASKPVPVVANVPVQLPVSSQSSPALSLKKKRDRMPLCPGETGRCTHAETSLEIENLDQLSCVSPVPKDLQTWLMQPDVVQLPAVAEVCRASAKCQSLGECLCLGSSHCLNYFYSLSKKTEDWLPRSQAGSIVSDGDFDCKSSTGEFEILSGTPTSGALSNGHTFSLITAPARGRKGSVSDELKMWLRETNVVKPGCCEWNGGGGCCMDEPVTSLVVSKALSIQDWLLQSH